MDKTYVVYDGYMFEFDLPSDWVGIPHRGPRRVLESDDGNDRVQAEPGESFTVTTPFDID